MGVGANLGDPVRQVERALLELDRWGRLRVSSLYRAEPLGERPQPWDINAVAEL
ncbi:MAG: 2-amino-4-hydroxy-6-hydroxymethyldihydropteridine diphosphokinase, partial [Deltaproteobacteria bacterium]|nr:2-amino-4-hydroxy-6-hydroxymethyldihydropteridine diphosphokinase [Deltaproteobacteria bacterium]